MSPFDPPGTLTVAFVALTLLVVVVDVWLVRLAAPPGDADRWTLRAGGVAVVWLTLHALVAESGVLTRQGPPPAIAFYLPPILLTAVALAASPLGRRLAGLPLGLLVGLQAFRVPLEVLLHALYDAGALPVQMTWSGWNFDVATGLAAAALALGARFGGKPPPRWLVGVWNGVGLALLVTVVVIAVTSTPGPLRRFMEDPPVLLALHAPYNWIVNVHVWTALVGHLVIARALLAWRDGERA